MKNFEGIVSFFDLGGLVFFEYSVVQKYGCGKKRRNSCIQTKLYLPGQKIPTRSLCVVCEKEAIFYCQGCAVFCHQRDECWNKHRSS